MSSKTILFWPESAYGPTNNCIGIGNVLKNRGHNVVFAAESSWGGKLSSLGFKEELVDLSAPPENADAQSAGQFWKDFIRDTSPEFKKPTVEQLETFITPTRQALIDGAIYSEPRLKEIIAKHLKEEKGYFVYPEMIDIVPLTNSKYEILVKAATKID